MEQSNELDIEREIEARKDEIKMLQEKKKLRKVNENRKLRVRSNNNGGPNILRRVSNKFFKKIEKINDKRVDNGFEELSCPKVTDLIAKHKSCWPKIEKDIIGYNANLESEREEFNQ